MQRHINDKMKKILLFVAAAMVLLAISSCKEEKVKKLNNIIVPPHEEVVPDTLIHQMNETESTTDVQWLNTTYRVHVHRYTNDSLTYITDNSGRKYRNNIISVKITRPDGSVFFDRKFTKAVFENHVEQAYLDKNVILGMVYNGNDPDCLRFIGSVGSPDVLSEEFVPYEITISRMGEVGVKKTDLDAVENLPIDTSSV